MRELSISDMLSQSPIPALAGDQVKINKVALVDADHIKYVVTHNMFKEKEEIGDEAFYENRAELLLEKTMSYTYSYLEKISDPILFCFSGPSHNTFRYKASFERLYKGNRAGKIDRYDYEGKKEDSYKIVDLIAEKFNVLVFQDLEADDILGFLHDDKTYIVSKDKDLLQFAGSHYDLSEGKIIEITQEQADRNLFYQILTGDTTDCITGIPRYGDKAFEKDFADVTGFENYLHKTQELFMEKFGQLHGLDMFCEMWMLVKMRIDRGTYFKEKYDSAYKIKDYLLKTIS